MNRSIFTLEEDLNLLPTLLPTPKTVKRFGDDLQALQAATTDQNLSHAYVRALGYVQALKDMEFLSDTQVPDLRELVFRTRQRCAIK